MVPVAAAVVVVLAALAVLAVVRPRPYVRTYVVVVILRVLVVLVSLAALIVFVVLVRSANSNAAICGVRHGYRPPILAARKAGYVRTYVRT